MEASNNSPSCGRCVRTITTRQTKWNNYTQKWKQQQLASCARCVCTITTRQTKWNELYTKVEQATTCLHVVRCVCTITQTQTKWNNYTQKWKQQQLAFMCEMCAYYNTKANEMKWLYTKVKQQQLAFMCEMCAKWINYTQKWKQQQLAFHVRDVCVL